MGERVNTTVRRSPRRLFAVVVAASTLAAPARATLPPGCNRTYSGPVNGQWAVFENWTPHGVPVEDELACIPANMGTITVDGAVTAMVSNVIAESPLHILPTGILDITDPTPGYNSSVTDLTVDALGAFQSITQNGVAISGDAVIDGTLNGPAELLSGSLGGTGNTGSLLNVGGTVRPGGAGAVGTLHVGGGFVQMAGGTLEIDVASAVSNDSILAPVVASNIGGHITVNLLNSFTPANNAMFVFIDGSSLVVNTQVTPATFTAAANGFQTQGILTFSTGATTTTTTVTTTTTTTTHATPTTVTTTTHPTTTTTTPPATAEVCGDCIDNDDDGLTDFEDASCCGGGSTTIQLRKGKIHPLKGDASLMQLDTTIPAPAGIDALKQDVFVQLRTADGRRTLLCARVPAIKFRKVRKTVTFRDRKHTVTSAELIEGIELRSAKKGGLFVHIEGRRLGFMAPTQTDLVLTLGFDDPTKPRGGRCATGKQTFRAPKHKDLLFP